MFAHVCNADAVQRVLYIYHFAWFLAVVCVIVCVGVQKKAKKAETPAKSDDDDDDARCV